MLYQYNDNDFRIVCLKGSEKKEKKEKKEKNDNTKTIKEEIDRIEISRAKRMIKEYALCNNFEYFVTLTLNSELCDRFSLSAAQEKLNKCLRAIKRKNKDFAYILITEKHKDGAFHFHGLMKNLTDLYENEYGYLSCSLFDKNLGFCSLSPIKDYTKCCNYITKYITKECIKNDKGTIYMCSRGLSRASVTKIEPIDFSKFAPLKKYFFNDFCKIKDFSLDQLTQQEKLYIHFIINTKNFIFFEG